jgi:hypothetical protein
VRDAVRRWGAAALALSLAVQALEWVDWLTRRVPDGLNVVDLWDYGWAADSATIQAAGSLVRAGGTLVRSPEAFLEALSGVVGYQVPPPAPKLLFTPMLGQLTATFAELSQLVGWLIVTSVGVALAVLALRKLGMSTAWISLCLLFAPVAWALRLGQLSIIAAGIIGLVAHLRSRDQLHVVQGILGGLLVLKPQYAIGLALLWVTDPRVHRRELSGAAATAAALIGISVLTAPAAWSGYLTHVLESTDALEPGRLARHVTARATFTLLAGASLARAAWLALAVVVVAGWRRFSRGVPASDRFVLAIGAGLLISPYTFDYDLVILLVPAALLWRSRIHARPDVVALFGLVAAAVIAHRGVAFATVLWFGGRSLLIAPIVIAAALLVLRRLSVRAGAPSEPAAP